MPERALIASIMWRCLNCCAVENSSFASPPESSRHKAANPIVDAHSSEEWQKEEPSRQNSRFLSTSARKLATP